ncbi:flavin reductase family protein [Roseinatronobacter sp. NSM]|uniref:flavin reductase family protein n=1 Tax=Roseinatronobacter sp. NSM TaxID=3457785 RepID=UPI00403617ED
MSGNAPDPRALRDAFGCFMTGVTVVTTLDMQGNPLGFTANSFASVSLDPPLLSVSIANRSANLAQFTQGNGFAVNILAEDQKDISATFARQMNDRFAEVFWRRGPVGSPLIGGVAAWFDCSLHAAIPAGDHTILIGQIGGFAATPAPGLGYYRGGYITPATTADEMPTGPDVVISAIFQAGECVLMVDDGRGGVTVPMVRVGRAGMQDSLATLMRTHGITAEPGQIYAIYEDSGTGTQHIALRCPTADMAAQKGKFVPLSSEGDTEITDPALRKMLARLASEARLGRYGIYFGNQQDGRVSAVTQAGAA